MATADAKRTINLATIRTLILLVTCVAMADQARTQPARETVESCSVNLIATPERYDGRLIQTWGVARMTFEGTAVYVSLESAQRRTTVNGVYLALADSAISESERKDLDLRWVHVVGVYHKPRLGSPDFRGHIDGIIHLSADEGGDR